MRVLNKLVIGFILVLLCCTTLHAQEKRIKVYVTNYLPKSVKIMVVLMRDDEFGVDKVLGQTEIDSGERWELEVLKGHYHFIGKVGDTGGLVCIVLPDDLDNPNEPWYLNIIPPPTEDKVRGGKKWVF